MKKEIRYYFFVIGGVCSILAGAAGRWLAHDVWWIAWAVAAVLVAAVFALCLVMSSRLTQRIVTTIEDTARHLSEGGHALFSYDELAPIVRALRKQNASARRRLERLNRERQRLREITQNMDEGLIVFDKDRRILSVNPGAVGMLDAASGTDFTGKSVYYLSRDERLVDCVKSASTGARESREIRVGNKSIEVFANPVYHGDEVSGVLCFLLDVTERGRNEKMRREFTANVSHELKTPLTTICGYAELLEGGMVKAEDVAQFGGKIHRESLRLLDMIVDILSLSELDDPPENLELTDCDLLGLAHDAAAALSHTAERLGVTLAVSGEPTVIRGNHIMLVQLVHNLVDNAIHYNRPGGSVTVTVDGAALRVEDTGIGIAQQHHSRIFERFYRVDKSRSKATGGTGLGLAIVKHAAEFHRAEVKIDSQEDVGTTIEIVFQKN